MSNSDQTVSESQPQEQPQSAIARFFGSGGYVLVLSLLLIIPIVVWRGSIIVSQWDNRAIGNGVDIDSYGYDTSNLTVDRDLICATIARDGIRPLTNPARLTVAEANEFHKYLRKEHRHKFIVGSDLVIGVFIDGVATAYPTRLLAWHQVVNDEVAGVPILVTYDPLCDSSVVFDRRVDDATLTFGTSGLVYNSNLMMYSKAATRDGESLWSQLALGGIAGPHAGRDLEIVTFAVLPWDEWRRKHPDTTVMKLDIDRIRLYRQRMTDYYGSDELKFPVRAVPPLEEGQLNKDRLVVFQPGGEAVCVEPADFAGNGTRQAGQIIVGDRGVSFEVSARGDSLWVDGPADDAPTMIPCFRFAAFAFGWCGG